MAGDCAHGPGFYCARCQPERIAAVLRIEYAALDRKYFETPPEAYDLERVRIRTPRD